MYLFCMWKIHETSRSDLNFKIKIFVKEYIMKANLLSSVASSKFFLHFFLFPYMSNLYDFNCTASPIQ